MWPGREADHSPPSSAEVKNAWSYTSTPQYALMAWCSVKIKVISQLQKWQLEASIEKGHKTWKGTGSKIKYNKIYRWHEIRPKVSGQRKSCTLSNK
jgi:hypothetical protein